MGVNNIHQPLLNFVVKASIIAVFVIGLLTCVEWITGMALLNAVFSNYTPMKLISADLLVLSSLSLWLYLSQSTWGKHVLRVTGGIILFVSFLTLLTYFHGSAAHQNESMIFNFFLQENNRMALITTLIFMFLGVIFILFANNSRQQDDIAHVLFFPAASMSYFAGISYVLGVSDLFKIEGINISPSIAFCLFLLCLVILFLKPDTWLMRILSGSGSGSIMGRRLLPWLLLLPVVIAWARIKGQQQHYFPSEVGVILLTITYTLTYIFLVWWSGLYINRIDQKKRQAYDALGENRARLNALITATSDGVYRMSPDWKLMVSMEGENFLTSVESPVDDWLNNFIPRDTQPRVLEAINRAITTKSKFELEHEVIRQDGSIGWTLSRAIPVLDKEGEIVEWLGIAHDFTERKAAEKYVLKSEKRMRALLSATSNSIYRMSPNWDTLYLLSGDFFNEVENQPYKPEEYIPAHSLPIVLESISNAIKNKHLFELEHEVYLPDGSIGWTFSRAVPIFNEEGEIEEWFGFAEDITQRKNAEQALVESEQKYMALFGNKLNAVAHCRIITDEQGKAIDVLHLQVNEGYEKIMGIRKEAIEGHTMKEVFQDSSPNFFTYLEIYRKVALEGSEERFETFFAPTGQYLSIYTYCPKHGEFIAIFTDITQRVQTEKALQQSEELFSKAFYNTPVPAIITRISDNIMTHVNNNFLKLFEYSDAEVIGHTTKELNLFADYGERMRALDILKREGYLQDHEFDMLTKTGKRLTLLISSVIVTIHEQKHVMTTYFDITERKRAELALQNSEKNLSDLYTSMSEGISVNQIIYDAEGNAVDYVLVDANPAFEKMTGQKLSEVKGMKGSERYSMQKAPYLDIWARVASSGEPAQFETYFAPLKKYFSVSAFSPEKGKFATLFWDITEIKLAEKAVLESTEQLRLLFENSLDAILYTNSDGTVHSMNPEAEKILGRSKEEMLHLMKKDVIDVNDPRYIAAREERQKTGRFKGELNFLKKDGTPFPVDLTSTTFKDSSGQEKSGFIFRDITERKRAEAALAFQSRLLSQVNDAVFSSDRNFRITYWNQTSEKLFGWTKEEALGHISDELLNPKIDVSTLEEARSKLKNEGYWIGEWQFVRKDGTSFFVEINCKTLKDNEGNYAGQIIVARDITERKQAQAEIIAAKEKAEESDRLKSAFLANMSHELRTPLNSIIGFSDLMMDPDFDSDQKSKYLQIINTSGNNLLMIINDIMDISKIEAGQVQVIHQLFSVNNLMSELKEEYSLKAGQKGIEIIFDPLNPSEEVFIESDQTKIRQILVNLVGNAIKFTEKGFVQLGWRITGNLIEFRVKDTGIGVSADYQAEIFERFRQVESSYTRKYGGTGLGLAITKNLLELMGGRIWLESEPGTGSTFYFTLPRLKA